jgi:putative glutamine amidotransferase
MALAFQIGDPGLETVGGGEQRPLIGVTTSEVRPAEQIDPTPQGEPPGHEMALGLTYMRAVERAGGLPVVIPPLAADAVEALVAHLDGVVLSGGPDIHPDAYGEPPHPLLGPTWRDLDLTELALARHATALKLPVLAICRGAQALNIARSGTLYQHLPDRFGGAIEHRQMKGASPGVAHEVEVEDGSVLAAALGCTRLEVNSFHHQSMSELGRGLRAVAWAPDGVVEGVEAPGSIFTVGVQWHAESMPDSAPQVRLFRSFVAAATHRTARLPTAALAA